MTKKYDAFISHASEDKDHFVRPLAIALSQLGVKVWYDEFSLKIGDSLSGSIDRGLAESICGIVIISPSFMEKKWPEYELRGLITLEISRGGKILPIWHGVTKSQVVSFSPTLADKVALKTEDFCAEDIAIQLLQVIRPDIYEGTTRAELIRIASGKALEELQHEFERTKELLDQAKEELSEYQCPICSAPLISRIDEPMDPEQKIWDSVEEYACGHSTVGRQTQRPCPSDPKFPSIDAFDFVLENQKREDEDKDFWICILKPKTDYARKLFIPDGFGFTEEEAKNMVIQNYEKQSEKWHR